MIVKLFFYFVKDLLFFGESYFRDLLKVEEILGYGKGLDFYLYIFFGFYFEYIFKIEDVCSDNIYVLYFKWFKFMLKLLSFIRLVVILL